MALLLYGKRKAVLMLTARCSRERICEMFYDSCSLQTVLRQGLRAARHFHSRLFGESFLVDQYHKSSSVPAEELAQARSRSIRLQSPGTVSYTHLRAHETPEHLVCRL